MIMRVFLYAITISALITLGVVLYRHLTKDLASNNLKHERAAINSNIEKMINELKKRDADTVQTGGYTPRPIVGARPSPPGKE